MQDRELAQRLVNYADAVAAIAFVSASAFGITAADPDIRCSLVGTRFSIAFVSVAIGVLFSAVLLLLRRWELDLRAEDALSAKGRRYARYLNGARYVLVWVSVFVSSLLVFTLTRTGCGG